jgi:hypothetical protein
MQLYWDVGRLIAERQQQHGWGKSVVETLARDLQAEFVGITGFSASSLFGAGTYPFTDTLPAELRPFFPSKKELVRRLDAVAAALRGA